MVKCKQCGNDFDEQYGVCPKCGWVYEAEEKLPEIKLPENTVAELNNFSKEKPASKKKSKVKLFVIIGIIAAVVIAGIIVGIILVNSNKGGMSEFEEQISLGDKYLKEENYDEAIAAFKKAIEIDPNDPEGYIKLADAYLAKGDTWNAVRYLKTGYEKTGSEEIKKKLDEIEKQEKINSEESSELEISDSEPSDSEISEAEQSESESSESENSEPEHPENNDLTVKILTLTDDDITPDSGVKKLDWQYPVFDSSDNKLKNYLDENYTKKIRSYDSDSTWENMLCGMTYDNSLKGYLTLRRDVTFYSEGMTHPLHGGDVHFIDLYQRKELKLSDVFKEDMSVVKKVLSKKLESQLSDFLGNPENVSERIQNIINDDTNFYITKDKLYICFFHGEVTSYSAGKIDAFVKLSDLELTPVLRSENESPDIEMKIPSDAMKYNNHSYYIYSGTAKTWEEAKEYCESLGGYLAIINSKEENDILFEYIKSKDCYSAYFGYSDSEEEGEWKWVEGDESEYTNWHSGEPNDMDGTEDYAMYYSAFTDGSWNDGDFSDDTGFTLDDTTYFICEWNNVLSDDTQVPENSEASETTEVSEASDYTVLNDIVGKYSGTYVGGQGLTALNFTINSVDEKGRVDALFEFYAHADNPGVPSGSYKMTGEIIGINDDGSASIKFKGTEWINKPRTYSFVNFTADISADHKTITSSDFSVNIKRS